MHKNEFIKQLAKETNLPQKEVSQVMKGFVELVARSLKDGDKVVLTGFGTFEVRTRSERRGVNPQTKESMTIPQTQTPGFTASNTLKLIVLGKLDPSASSAVMENSPDGVEKLPIALPKKRGRKPAKVEVQS